MNLRTSRTVNAFACLALACIVALASTVRVGAAKGGLKKSEAQKLVAAYSLLELGKAAVTIREITPGDSSATVAAMLRVGVRFERDAKGDWRAVELRIGDREWESFDLLARTFNNETFTRGRDALDSLAAALDALGRAKAQREDEKKKSTGPEEKGGRATENARETKKKAGGKSKSGQKTSDKIVPELVRGALRVKNPETALSPIGKSAVVEVEIETAFDVVRDGGKWRVATARIGGEKLPDADAFERALDAEKARLARADLEALAAALETFHSERGFYIVADSETTLVDFLNPHYTRRIIRVDPWHHPYEYTGTHDSFTLRSLGADGKPNTGDDLILHK